MKHCSNLFFLSVVACRLSECLSEKELTALAADLVVLSDMLASLVAHQDLCSESLLSENDSCKGTDNS